jgi:hypothetical protein
MRFTFCWTLLGTLLVLLRVGSAFGQDTNFATGPQYLMQGSSLLARPISTPSRTLSGPALEVGASNATAALSSGASNQDVSPPNPDALPAIDLFPIYYGTTRPSVVEISFSSGQSSEPLPASILDSGVGQIADAQTLRERGYGVTIAEAAAFSKERIRHANHVYTNADIERLHSGS